jgi:hypothetical protein
MVSAQEMFYESDLDGDDANNYAERLNGTKERAVPILHRISEYVDSNPDKPAEFQEALMGLYNVTWNAVNLLDEYIEEIMGVDPTPYRGKHLQIDEIRWDREGQAFVIELSCSFGLATAGEHADFKMVTNLEIVTRDATFNERLVTGFFKAVNVKKNSVGFIKLEPLWIPWTKDDGWYSGTILLNLNLIFYNPGSGGMTQIDPPSLKIDGGVPEDD